MFDNFSYSTEINSLCSSSESDPAAECYSEVHINPPSSYFAADKIMSYQQTVQQSLRQWVIECNIPRNHVSNLLKRLKNDAKLEFLPLDRRTLLSSTRSKVSLIDVPPGKYKHLNVENSLQLAIISIVNSGQPVPKCLSLVMNIDGLPISKSSRSEFWPILFKVKGN